MLGPGTLRTGHATFTASGSSVPLWAFLLVPLLLSVLLSMTVGVGKAVCGLIVAARVAHRESVLAYCPSDGSGPLFPLVWALRPVVDVQQEHTTG